MFEVGGCYAEAIWGMDPVDLGWIQQDGGELTLPSELGGCMRRTVAPGVYISGCRRNQETRGWGNNQAGGG